MKLVRSLAVRLGAGALVLACALLAGTASTHAQIAAAPFLVPFGAVGNGSGNAIMGPNNLSVTVIMDYVTPNATYQLAACQTAPVLLTSSCLTAGTVTSNGLGKINQGASLPALQELDYITMQNTANSFDFYMAIVGPNSPPLNAISTSVGTIVAPGLTPASGFPIGFPGTPGLVFPGSQFPGACPPGFVGITTVFVSGLGLVTVSCP
jgi:hypothetical protein